MTGRKETNMKEHENMVAFTDEELDLVLDYMKQSGAETVQEAVIKAFRDAKQKDQILKAVWDVLHEGVSTDRVADQDWVYERIRNRVEQTY